MVSEPQDCEAEWTEYRLTVINAGAPLKLLDLHRYAVVNTMVLVDFSKWIACIRQDSKVTFAELMMRMWHHKTLS